MRKLNKQEFMFIGGTLLFILVTFIAYLFIEQHFIVDNCPILDTLGGLGGMPHICFGYLKFFEKSSIYFYILFLWITIIPSMMRKYLLPGKWILIGGVLILMLIILYSYGTTHIMFFDDLSKDQQQLYFYR